MSSYKFVGDKKPYYEKYNENDNYVKVLFSPGKPLQAQELGNMQTYIQNQFSVLGDTLYKNGSPASGAYVTFSADQPVLRVSCNTTYENFITKLETLKGTDMICDISGVTYSIRVSDYYVQYQKDSSGRTTSNILNYYILFSYLSDTFTIPTLTPITFYIKSDSSAGSITAYASTSQMPNPTKALTATNSEGYIYIDGYFVHANKNANANTKKEAGPLIVDILNDINDITYSSIPVYDDNNNPVYIPYSDMQYYIGFEITRNYITSADDTNLFDQASGSVNYKSSGADRYQVLPILTSYYYYNDDNTNFTTASKDFIQSLVIKNNTIIKQQVATINGTLEDTLAERTYDESGSYTVNPWKVQLYDIDNDNSKYTVQIDAGLGYIMGYRVETLVSTSITNDKPRNDYITMNNITSYVKDDCYTYGLFQTTINTVTDEEITGTTYILKQSTNITGLKIYTKDKTTNYISGTDYTYDSSTNIVTVLSETLKTDGGLCSYNYSNYPVGSLQAYNFPNFKKLQNIRVYSDTYENIKDLSIYERNLKEVLPSSYIYPENDESTDEEKEALEKEREEKIRMKVFDCDLVGKYFMIYFLNTKYISSIFAQGKCICTVEDDIITSAVNLYQIDGFAKLFGTEQPKIIDTGSKYVKADTGMNSTIEYMYTAITKASCSGGSIVFTVPTNVNSKSTVTSNALVYIHDSSGNYLDTSNLDFDVEGTGSNTYITISKRDIADSSDLIEDETYTIAYKITQNGFTARTKTLHTVERTYNLQDDDDINLELCDIVRIDKITISNEEIDSSKYSLDNGQRDYIYDYGHVTGLIKSGAASSGNQVTIQFTYFEHSGYGPCNAYSYVTLGNSNYYSNKDSYANIPEYTASNGSTYILRDCLDFRPLISGNLENYNLPTPDSSVSFSFQRYLPRYDSVCVSKSGEFFINTGIASDDPQIPNIPDGCISIYTLYNAPYVINTDFVKVSYINNQRYTMKDISHLENRIYNLETTISLSQLEQDAVNMQITDSNGLNRYKTGIFTDNFSNFDNCNYTNEDWDCNIDSKDSCIRPNYECENLEFSYNSSMSDTIDYAVTCTMPPVKNIVFVKNDCISETHNVQGLMFYTWYGGATLTPSIDTWVNNLGNKVVATNYIETTQPPTAFRSWSLNSTGTQKMTETTNYSSSWEEQLDYTLMESQDTYMRVRTVGFELTGMKANSSIKATFDNKNITLYSDEDLTTLCGKVNTDGTLTGYFQVPENMTVGTKLVKFYSNSDDSSAETEYSAHGKTIWTEITKNYIRTWNATKSYTVSGVGITTTSTATASANVDPIAETFLTGKTPIVLDSIDVYFAKIDNTVPIELYVVETVNGYPGDDILAFSDVVLSPNEKLKDRNGRYYQRDSTGEFVYKNGMPDTLPPVLDSSGNYVIPAGAADAVLASNITWTTDAFGNKTYKKSGNIYPVRFIFSEPLVLQANTEYAFIVATGSYSYELCTSTLGSGDIITQTAIKEQPYTGSMFISQNARTWTAVQESDISFRINEYVYNSSNTYSAVFNIDYEKDEPYFVDFMNLCANTYCPTGTSIKYYYRYGSGNNWTEFENKSDIFNKNREVLSNNYSLQLKMDLLSENDTITPQLDLEQIYGIFTYNNLKYLDANNEEQIYTIKCHDSYSGDDKVYFDTNVYNDNKLLRYHCGTYISNQQTLENASNTIRVILACKKPNNSDIQVFFKTTSYKPYYVTTEDDKEAAIKNITLSDDTYSYNSCVNKTLNLYTYTINETTGKYEFNKIYMDTAKTNAFTCYVSNIKDNKVYMTNISEKSLIKTYDYRTDEPTLLSGHNIFVDASELITEIKEYSYTGQYYEGDYVYDGNNIWKVLEDISGVQFPLPKYISIYNPQFELVSAFSSNSLVTEEEESDWRELTTENSKSSTDWIDYTYTPNVSIDNNFTAFQLKIELYSYNETDVPEFKDLRAIAIV